jgi:hypothetical protein
VFGVIRALVRQCKNPTSSRKSKTTGRALGKNFATISTRCAELLREVDHAIPACKK